MFLHALTMIASRWINSECHSTCLWKSCPSHHGHNR
jgi:hypothetical protein